MLLPLRLRASSWQLHTVRRASTFVNPGMSKITNLDKSAGDPHAKVRDMSVFPKEKIRCVCASLCVCWQVRKVELIRRSRTIGRNISIIAHIDASPYSHPLLLDNAHFELIRPTLSHRSFSAWQIHLGGQVVGDDGHDHERSRWEPSSTGQGQLGRARRRRRAYRRTSLVNVDMWYRITLHLSDFG